MTNAPVHPLVDTAALRDAIRAEYAAVAISPAHGFHFHTGRPLARLLAYPDELLEGSRPGWSAHRGL